MTPSRPRAARAERERIHDPALEAQLLQVAKAATAAARVLPDLLAAIREMQSPAGPGAASYDGPRTSGHADMGDPLAPFRLPDGSVAYLSIPVGGLRAGDWFQRQRGDDGWHQVRPLIFGGDQVGVPFDETGLEWFGRDQMVRVARTPEHVVAAQERRWETGR